MDYCGSSFLKDLWGVVFLLETTTRRPSMKLSVPSASADSFFHVPKSLLCYSKPYLFILNSEIYKVKLE